MLPYLLLLLLTGWIALTHMRPSLLIVNPSLGLSWSVLFVVLVLMIGFRHEVGGDWEAYLVYVENVQGESIYTALRGDPAFELLNWFGANVGGGVYFVNLVCGILFCWGLTSYCRALPRPWLALFVAVSYLVMVVAMGYSRQGVAIGLAMLAITRLQSGSLIRFLFWISLATLFHKSAVVLLPIALFSASRYVVLSIFGVAASAAILFAVFLQEQLDYFSYVYLEAEYASSGAGVRIAMNAVPAALFLGLRQRFRLDPNAENFWKWMAWSALLFIPLLVVSPSSTAVDRVALYWIPLQLMVFSRLPDALGVHGNRNPFWVYLVAAYSAIVMLAWLFFADTAHAWLPYRFYPWEALWS